MYLKTLKEKFFAQPVIAERDQFVIKFAETEEEIRQAQKLRYRVFNLEQGKGLEAARATGIDTDEFDEHCFHLIVYDKTSGEVVGTYRMHFGMVAKDALGFYSSREYDLKWIKPVADDCLEVGRSCVSPEYRRGAVVALLWNGIGVTLTRSNVRYLIGCVSLENTDPAVGWAMYESFVKKNLRSDILAARPVEAFSLPRPPQENIDSWLADPAALQKEIPPLFKGYLRLGSKICGEPAMDNEFGTIDFMIVLDTKTIPERYARHFMVY